MFKSILFDFDGTIADSAEGVTKSVQYALQCIGIRVDDPDDLRCFVGPPLLEMLKEKYKLEEGEALKALLKYRERYVNEGFLECRLFPFIPEMLQKLKDAGKTAALATSKPQVYVEEIMDMLGVSGYFDVIVGCELDGRRSKKSQVIEEAMRQLGEFGFNTKDVVMVGDTRYDIEGAKKVGIPCIGVEYSYAAPGELRECGADFTVPDVQELLALLLSDTEEKAAKWRVKR